MHKVKQAPADEVFPIINEILQKGKSAQITVTGMSMYPFLRSNIDSVELSPSGFDKIRRNDIVMIKRDNNQYILHRVFKKKKDCFYIVGDAQQLVEGPLHPGQLVAIVTAVRRQNKIIACSNIQWKLLSWIWLILLPLRGFLIKTYRALQQLKRNKG